MTDHANRYPVHSFDWWITEGRLSEADGHFDAARAAYGEALKLAADDEQREIAQFLSERVPS